MRLNRRHGRQCAVDGLARDVVFDEAVRLRPGQHRPDAPAQLPGDVQFPPPDRRQDPQHVFAADLVHGHIGDDGKGVAFQLLHPIGGRLVTSPPWAVGLVRLDRGLPKRQHSGLAFLGQRIAPVADGDTVGERTLPGLCQRHDGPAAQADVPALAVDGEPLDPRLRPAGRHAQIQRAAVTVQAWYRERLQLRCSQFSHVVPTS